MYTMAHVGGCQRYGPLLVLEPINFYSSYVHHPEEALEGGPEFEGPIQRPPV